MNEGMKAITHLMGTLQETPMSPQQYKETVITKLREAIPFDAACCTTVDPNTLLSTGAITEQGVEDIHSKIFEYEYLHEDFNPYEQLAHAVVPVASLSGATEGQLERSGRYRAVLQPAGFGDELRVALMSEGACWGYLTLFRFRDSPFFQEEECTIIASIAPFIASTLRTFALSLPAEDMQGLQEEGNGIMVLSDQLIPLTFNAVAKHWLTMLRGLEQLDSDALPRPVRAVCSRALAEGIDTSGKPSKAKICLRIEDGNYLSIVASRLEGPTGLTQLAVSFEPAKSSDTLPLIAEAYALSVREKEIVEQISKGLSTKELAQVLHISAYTVQDHLKSIFSKTGVTSRRELIWKLFSRYSLRLK
ncbi:MAG TPA: LuxR C-terminal-related transcriptional regulator [Paenibacillus sp.]|jgi:DNA-binding CsgD family transcriptional regulator